MRPITDSLELAFDRIDAFEAVQADATHEELLEAVCLLQEAVGITAETRAAITCRLDGIAGSSKAPGHVLLGLIVGLMAAQLDEESSGATD